MNEEINTCKNEHIAQYIDYMCVDVFSFMHVFFFQSLMLQRPESPETAITERTHTNQSSVHREGVFLKPAPGGHRAETFPAQHR